MPLCGILIKTKIPPKNMFENKNNFMSLQSAFDRMKLGKAIPIDRLMRAKLKDNYEFLQWCKKLYDTRNKNGDEISASIPRRNSLPNGGRCSSYEGHCCLLYHTITSCSP